MKRFLILALTLIPGITGEGYAQSNNTSVPTQWETYRQETIYLSSETVTTCFQSTRLEVIIEETRKRLHQDTGFQFIWRRMRISDSDFNSLTPAEKFIYAHQYPESYMQACSIFEYGRDMSYLWANIPYLMEGAKMSQRQEASLAANRDTTIACLSRCTDFSRGVPLGYKKTILELNAWNFIPSLLELEDKINNKVKGVFQDPYVYTMLMALMVINKFDEFEKTELYKQLYGPEASYRTKIGFTKARRNEVVDFARRFYQKKTLETP